MKNEEIAGQFDRIADLMEIFGEQGFRVNSYRKAARALRDLSEDVAELARQDRLGEIEGIGDSTSAKIRQYLSEGKIDRLEELSAKAPATLPELLTVSGLGPKTVAKLWKEADIKGLADLKAALAEHPETLEGLAGLGPRKVQQIRESLAFAETAAQRIRIGEADALAQTLLETLRHCDSAGRIMLAGSLRRGKETIGDIDILAEAQEDQAPAVIEAFVAASGVQRVLARGPTKCSVTLDKGVQADLRVLPSRSFGAALCYFTGSKEHNVRIRELAVKQGFKLNEYGLFKGDQQIAGEEEDEIYRRLGLSPVPPELREDRGEVEAAAQGQLPALVELGDIRGDLHMHTRASDGANTIEEMIHACKQHDYEYMAICDHSRSQVQAHGLDEARLAEHVQAIHRAGRQAKGIAVLAGCEVDIFKDGELDFDAGVLGGLDFVTASPHSALSQGRAEATKRLIKAIESPHVNVIGHPSGRIVNGRPGMDIDIEKIAEAAAANGVALEINAHPWRLDLRDTHVRAAIDKGASILICTDAHHLADLDFMKYGVQTARRGWARAADVVNTWTLKKLRDWIARKK